MTPCHTYMQPPQSLVVLFIHRVAQHSSNTKKKTDMPARVRRRGASLAAALLLGAVLSLSPSTATAADGSASVQHDCTCQCCKADTCPDMKTYKVAVGSKEECTDALCRSNFFDCPDYGAHNAVGGIVTASYHDCTCSCCRQGTCGDGLKEYTFEAGGPERCSADQCSSQFYGCPDPGAHHTAAGTADDALVFATYHDCMCACCKDGECPDLRYNMFMAGSPGKCNAAACSAKFFSCPDSGSHNAKGSVVAYYSGSVPPPPPPTVAPAVVSVPVAAKKGETVLPTYGVALVALGGAVAVLVGVYAYRRVQKERGYKWVKFDDVAEVNGGAGGGAGGGEEVRRSNGGQVEMDGANGARWVDGADGGVANKV